MENKLRESIHYLKTLLSLEVSDSTYNIVYLILFIIQLSPELNEMDKNNLSQCISYYFYHPLKLLDILDYLINEPLSPQMTKEFIESKL